MVALPGVSTSASWIDYPTVPATPELPLLLKLPADPIVLPFQRATVEREGASDCTRLPLLQCLPVLLPLVLHHPVDPIQPGRPVMGLQPGRSVAYLPVVGLSSGKVHQMAPKKVPLFLPWPFGDPVMFFPQSLLPLSPGRRPSSLARQVESRGSMEPSYTDMFPPNGINSGLRQDGRKRFPVLVYLPSWSIESCPLIITYMQPFENAAFRKLESCGQ